MAHVNRSLTKSLALALIGASALSGAALHAQSMSKPMAKEGAGMMAPAAMIQGTFRKAEAPVSGGFTIKKEGDRKLLVLSSDFKTNDMAPDLKVIFSPSSTPLASTKAPGFPLKPGSYTILAALKSSSGAQSYEIPASIDLKAQGSVLIWCKKFNATMAWSPLKP
ncbi:MAG: DM13 domain-containing protein [Prochlorococcaceae cyanobacterium]